MELEAPFSSGERVMAKTVDLEDGGIIEFTKGSVFYLCCCDCALTHKVEGVVVGRRKVQIKITRDNNRTIQNRHKHRTTLKGKSDGQRNCI